MSKYSQGSKNSQFCVCNFLPKAKRFLFTMLVNVSLMMEYFVLWHKVERYIVFHQHAHFLSSVCGPICLSAFQVICPFLSLTSASLSLLQQLPDVLISSFPAAMAKCAWQTGALKYNELWNGHIHSYLLLGQRYRQKHRAPTSVLIRRKSVKPSHFLPSTGLTALAYLRVPCPYPAALTPQCTAACSVASWKAGSSREQPPTK